MSNRLLVINPNTTVAMTEKVAEAARQFLPEAEVSIATGRFGARYISSRASYAVACHASLDCYASDGRNADIVLLACFGDPGLDALREVSNVPVIGLVDASVAEAGAGGRSFSIVTGGERWGPMLRETLRVRGLENQVASIRTVAPSGGTIAADPAAAYAMLAAACQQCADEDKAEAVILGGAGLLGIAAAIQARVSVPLICSVEAGFRAVQAAMAAPASSTSRIVGTVPVETIGLSTPLDALFGNG